MIIPNKFNGYSRDGLRRYNDPVSAGLVASGTGALGGAATVATGLGALETGLAAGSLIAGGGGLLGELGLSAIGAPALGGLSGAATPAIAAEIAPAALAQATQTIAPSIAQSAGLDALKQQALQGGLSQVTPTMEQMGARFLANSPPIAPPYAGETLLADISNTTRPLAFEPQVTTPSWMSNTLEGSALPGVTSKLTTAPAAYGNLVGGPAIPGVTSELAAAPAATQLVPPTPTRNFLTDAFEFFKAPSWQGAKDYAKEHPYATATGVYGLYKAMQPKNETPSTSPGLIRPYTYERTQRPEAYNRPSSDTSERLYFNDRYTALEPYEAPGPEYKKASGGLASFAIGGPVEEMAAMNAVGANTGYPMANLQTPMYSNPMVQRPEAANIIAPSADVGVGAYTGEARFASGGNTETEGGYKYSYDPQTMQFTQLSAPVIRTPIVGQYGNQMGYDVSPVENPGSKISGGLSAPAMSPMPIQQAAPVNIPAYQSPEQRLGLEDFYNYMNKQLRGFAGYAAGGSIADASHLGDYSDGGRLLRGPGDGVSDSIPASIGNRQPARLADGEFVVPARIVSELGNGSTEAGARKLYAMMDRVQNARKKSIGKKKVAVNSKADKHLPA